MFTNISKHIFKISVLLVISLLSVQVSYANNVISDSVITTKIKAKTALDETISVLNVDVETNNGIVSLDGTVDSDTQASAMVEIAQSTQGVRDVDTANLTVKKSHAPINDTFITAKVKGVYLQQKLFKRLNINPANIHVETNNSIVYLSGSVKSKRLLNKVVSLAKSVHGVKNVESRLKIEA